tara:strand:+ start:27 stop:203 length:177 start_codon:yes stop_codon:yes gene_type:complete
MIETIDWLFCGNHLKHIKLGLSYPGIKRKYWFFSGYAGSLIQSVKFDLKLIEWRNSHE